jgi:hypothetical protein
MSRTVGIAAAVGAVVATMVGTLRALDLLGAPPGGEPLFALPFIAAAICATGALLSRPRIAWAGTGAMLAIIVLWIWSAGSFYFTAGASCIATSVLVSIGHRERGRRRYTNAATAALLAAAAVFTAHLAYRRGGYSSWLVLVALVALNVGAGTIGRRSES